MRQAKRITRAVLSLSLVAALCGATGSLASADPGSPAIPGQDQIDKANADVQARKTAADALQTSLNAADQQLRVLESQAGQAVEAYDAAVTRSAAAHKVAADALVQSSVAESAKNIADLHLGAYVEVTYREGPDITRAAALMHASTLQELTDREQMLKTVARLQAEAVNDARQADLVAADWQSKAEAAARKQQDAERAAAVARDAAQQSAAAEQGEVSRIGAQRENLLAQLAAAQGIAVALERQRQQGLAEGAAQAAAAAREATLRRGAASRGAESWGSIPYAVGAAQTMLQYVYAQLGKPYVWGGAGPDVFDCSGLAMRGLEAAGWDFPHPAQWQYLDMHPLGHADLRPADLVFWAEDASDPHTIYHEAVYIGNDRIIQAPRPGGVVEIQSLWVNGPPSFYGRP